jgi:hypothetical protein
MMQRADFVDRIGTDNVCATLEDAILRAKNLLAEKKERSSQPSDHTITHDSNTRSEAAHR